MSAAVIRTGTGDGQKKTRAHYRRGFGEIYGSSLLSSRSILCGCIGAGSLVDARSSFVFLAQLFNQAAGDKILKLLVSAQAEHLLTAAHRVADLEIGENALEEIVEAEHLFLSKDIAKFIGDMVGKAT